MTIADTLSDFLVDHDIDYHVFPHPYAESAGEAARAAHIAPDRVAKAVVFVASENGKRRYRMAVLPASHHIDLQDLRACAQENVELAKEYELTVLFPDCAVGAIPIVGQAYGLPTIVDKALTRWSRDVFFEAGDHEELIKISADQFRRIMSDAKFGAFSERTLQSQTAH